MTDNSPTRRFVCRKTQHYAEMVKYGFNNNKKSIMGLSEYKAKQTS